MKTIKYILLSIVFIILLLIICDYIIWLWHPKTEINIFVLDKSVKNFNYETHRSFFEILGNSRITKLSGDYYDCKRDYYGFFPQKPLSNRQYKIKRISLEQIDSISDTYDVLYYIDTYGISYSEWYKEFRANAEGSLIEGGLNQNDYLLLRKMKEKNKLIMLEYNTLGIPTSELIRYKTENLLGIHSSGWIGKFVSNLDSSNKAELPSALVNKYFFQNNRHWPYKGPGIILTNNNKVIVLQKNIHLISEKPYINSCNELQNKFHLPDDIEFLNWFEIVSVADTNEVLAYYNIYLTDLGDSIIHANNLSASFPAIIYAYNKYGLNMFYFAGDFAYNRVNRFNFSLAINRKLIEIINPDDNKSFYQSYYCPLIKNILMNYCKNKMK